VALRVPNGTFVGLSQDFVQQMRKLPGGKSVLHQRLPGYNHPERFGLLGLVDHNNNGAGMFGFKWRFQAI